MYAQYKTDHKSRKTLLICDVISVISVVALIIGFILLYSKSSGSRTGSLAASMMLIMILVYGSILLMIVMSIIRKKLKK